MEERKHFIVFKLEDKQFALPLEPVDRVVRAVEVTVLPKVPTIVRGIINYKGTVLPVIDIRSRFHLPEREIRISDQFIIIRTVKRPIALLADTVTGNIEKTTTDIVPPAEFMEGIAFLEGVLKLKDGVMLIPNLEKILTLKESSALNKAIKNTGKKEQAEK